jgi:hypothetical protein
LIWYHNGLYRGAAPDAEKAGLAQLDRCVDRPVAFAVRANVTYNNDNDDDSPVHGRAVAFTPGDFLHIIEVWLSVCNGCVSFVCAYVGSEIQQ